MSDKESQRIRELACLCASKAIVCRNPDESPVPLVWSFAVFFEQYIRNGAEGTRKDFGPKKPAKLKLMKVKK